MRQAIEALPVRSQTALKLYRLEGLGQIEVARQMGISRSAVEKHLSVAMKHLRFALADCGILQAAASCEDVMEQGETSRADKQP